MRDLTKVKIGLSTLICMLSWHQAQAAEIVTHQYDALGRLKQTTKTGGPANGEQIKTNHDPAGNRSCQSTTGVGGVGGASCPPPPG